MLSPSLFGETTSLLRRRGCPRPSLSSQAATAVAPAVIRDPPDQIALVVLHPGPANRAKAVLEACPRLPQKVPEVKLRRAEQAVRAGRLRQARGARAPRSADPTDDAAARPRRRGRQRPARAGCRGHPAGRRHRRARLTAEAVGRYYEGRAEVTPSRWLTSPSTVGDVPAALEALRWALHVGVDPVPDRRRPGRRVRTVARVAIAPGGVTPYQLASSLGMPAVEDRAGAAAGPRLDAGGPGPRPCRSPPSATPPSRAAPTTGRTPWSGRISVVAAARQGSTR